ncbi:hypothetical protein CcCBS67573_g10290 [Chytriomyces confervae]|uniref:Methyltransferase domain-containing protein n=1 Tax=Chytriomyces confervae TaxID=246404 RepID=A0A507D6J1_9FUNG|nr:hypothetical protein CcCBS67573_g10290 [Chytriomyces confervae]
MGNDFSKLSPKDLIHTIRTRSQRRPQETPTKPVNAESVASNPTPTPTTTPTTPAPAPAPAALPAPSVVQAAETDGAVFNDEDAVFWHPSQDDSNREYHNVDSSSYFLPSDMQEQTRLDLQHHMLVMLFKDPIICTPVKEIMTKKSTKVLDVGCAMGTWLDSVYRTYLNPEYHGVDIADELNQWEKMSMAKCVFGNVLEGLPYEDNTFNFVHQRLLFTGVPKAKWPGVIAELARVTKSGGWIQLLEYDVVTYRQGPASKALGGTFAAMLDKRGMDIHAGSNLVPHMNEASNNSGGSMRLTNITQKTVSCPIGWGGKVGELFAQDSEKALQSMKAFLPKIMGLTNEAYDALVKENMAECGRNQSFGNFTCVYAQVVKN